MHLMQEFTINKKSLLRVLLGVYLFPLYLVCFSLGVPPSDLPLCGVMLALAAFGLVLARRESRAWRVIWASALVVSLLCGVLEVIAGQRIAHQRSEHDSSMILTIPNRPPEPTAVLAGHSFGAKADGAFRSAVAVHAATRRWLSFLR